MKFAPNAAENSGSRFRAPNASEWVSRRRLIRQRPAPPFRLRLLRIRSSIVEFLPDMAEVLKAATQPQAQAWGQADLVQQSFKSAESTLVGSGLPELSLSQRVEPREQRSTPPVFSKKIILAKKNPIKRNTPVGGVAAGKWLEPPAKRQEGDEVSRKTATIIVMCITHINHKSLILMRVTETPAAPKGRKTPIP